MRPATAAARQTGMKAITLTGRGGAQRADVLSDAPCDGPSARIQEANATVRHALRDIVCQATTSK